MSVLTLGGVSTVLGGVALGERGVPWSVRRPAGAEGVVSVLVFALSCRSRYSSGRTRTGVAAFTGADDASGVTVLALADAFAVEGGVF